MKRSPSWVLASSIALAGVSTLVLGGQGWITYGYDRLRFGSTIDAGGHCYRVPEGWTLLGPTSVAENVDLQRHFDRESRQFASVRWGTAARTLVERGTKVRPVGNGFELFELQFLPEGNPIRHLAMDKDQRIAIVGTSGVAVAYLAANLSSC